MMMEYALSMSQRTAEEKNKKVTTWVDTLAELTNEEDGKLFPTLFYECSGCNGTGFSKLSFSISPHDYKPCTMFKCEGGLRRKDSARVMGVLVRIYRELYVIGKADRLKNTMWFLINEEPEEALAKIIAMRVALINYTGKNGNTT